MHIQTDISAAKLLPKVEQVFDAAADKVRAVHRTWDPATGSPVFTQGGVYALRGWTEWTMGFHIGSALLQYDATGDREFLELGRIKTLKYMAPHVSHVGVHDHGFNNVSTYGNLRRMMQEGSIPFDQGQMDT